MQQLAPDCSGWISKQCIPDASSFLHIARSVNLIRIIVFIYDSWRWSSCRSIRSFQPLGVWSAAAVNLQFAMLRCFVQDYCPLVATLIKLLRDSQRQSPTKGFGVIYRRAVARLWLVVLRVACSSARAKLSY